MSVRPEVKEAKTKMKEKKKKQCQGQNPLQRQQNQQLEDKMRWGHHEGVYAEDKALKRKRGTEL